MVSLKIEWPAVIISKELLLILSRLRPHSSNPWDALTRPVPSSTGCMYK